VDYALGGGSSGATERDAGVSISDAATIRWSALSRGSLGAATLTKPAAHAERIWHVEGLALSPQGTSPCVRRSRSVDVASETPGRAFPVLDMSIPAMSASLAIDLASLAGTHVDPTPASMSCTAREADKSAARKRERNTVRGKALRGRDEWQAAVLGLECR
jgi:hypothetical protein